METARDRAGAAAAAGSMLDDKVRGESEAGDASKAAGSTNGERALVALVRLATRAER